MTVRLAVIGCGAWGINHVRSSTRLKNAEVVAVCDASEQARSRANSVAPNARAVGDPAEIFKDDEIDAVIIATPAPTHASLVKEALSANKHVLVEKPFVLDPADGAPLVADAKERKRTLMVGHLLRYHPAFQHLENLVRLYRGAVEVGGEVEGIHGRDGESVEARVPLQAIAKTSKFLGSRRMKSK